MRRAVLAAAFALGASIPAAAQYNDYASRYGPPIDVTVDDLLQMPEQYADRAIHTRGELEMLPTGTTVTYAFRGTFGRYLYIYPVPEVSYEFDQGAKRWVGKEIEVTGALGMASATDATPSGTAAVVSISIWSYLAPPDERAKKGPISPDATLEQLVTHPDQYDGKMVNVKGQFRGENLFGDLPSASRQRSSDWVIKEDLFAVWVTGRKPKGSGWSLEADMKRDTGKWLLVTGRVRVSRSVVTIEATDVSLTRAPDEPGIAAAKPAPTPPPPAHPIRPPMVAFSLPLDGEREVARDSVFKIQFSHDMDETSFKDHVVFRYAGRVLPGDNALDAVKVSYDGGLRALTIDPGDLLRPGRVVEVLLLPGIKDLDGKPLEPRPGVQAGAAIDVLRFQVVPEGLAGDTSR
jgi:hypothetical protein